MNSMNDPHCLDFVPFQPEIKDVICISTSFKSFHVNLFKTFSQ